MSTSYYLTTVLDATLSLLRETVVPLLQKFSCGGSTGWRRVVYLNMSDPSQRCPLVWQEITTPHRVCGRRLSTRGCEGLTYSTGGQQYNQVCGRIISYQLGHPDAFRSSTSTTMLRELVSHVASLTNTSGPLLLVLMNRLVVQTHAPVSMGALVEALFPHSLARTTSVRLA